MQRIGELLWQSATIVRGRFLPPSSDLRAPHGLHVASARWDSRSQVRGVVQIAHGMGEHIARYADLIEALVSAGAVTVYGNDHRGHGRTAPSPTQLGDFGACGFDLLVEDMIRLSRIAREENPGQPFILLGHSMGSFAAQQNNTCWKTAVKSTGSFSRDRALSTGSRF